MANHSISLEQARQVAKLSRLELSDEKLNALRGQLESVFSYVAAIAEAQTAGIEPMPHAVPLTNVLRDDTAGPTLTLEQVLRNAPQADGSFFAVPKVIGGDEDSAG